MTNSIPAISRAHHTNAAQGTEKKHTLIISVADRPGAIDRVIGVLRRRRSQLQSLALGPGVKPETFRVTAQVRDAEVVIDHLIEQIRKIIDVQDVTQVDAERAVTRELVLIQLETTVAGRQEIIKAGEQFSAKVVDEAPGTVTLEATGSGEQIDQLLVVLQAYTIREIARSGSVVVARNVEPTL
jgi:acetolactate synthase I/III small subunit